MIDIRPLAAADEPAWRRLWSAYLDFYETALPDEVFAQTFARYLPDGDPAMHALLAVKDGTPVGLVHHITHRHGWKLDDIVYLQDLFVDPDMRGAGVGRALIEAVYAAADAAGTPDVYWLTQEFNYRGRMLYDRIAKRTPFIVYGR